MKSKTISGRVLSLAWCFACMILSASYTANLATALLRVQEMSPASPATTGFSNLMLTRSPVCVRGGTAPESLLRGFLPPGYPIRSVQGASISAVQRRMADMMRRGECNAIAVTNWYAGDILVSDANHACDLRQLYGENPVPARGGYTAADPLMRRRAQVVAHGAAAMNRSDVRQSTECSTVPTAALGVLLREFEGLSSFKSARAEQLARASNSSCSERGEPSLSASSASSDDASDASLGFTSLSGLWLILAIAALMSILTAPPTLRLWSAAWWGFSHSFTAVRTRTTGIVATVTRTDIALKQSDLARHKERPGIRIDALNEMLRPQTNDDDTMSNWRIHVDNKLEAIEAMLKDDALMSVTHAVDVKKDAEGDLPKDRSAIEAQHEWLRHALGKAEGTNIGMHTGSIDAELDRTFSL